MPASSCWAPWLLDNASASAERVDELLVAGVWISALAVLGGLGLALVRRRARVSPGTSRRGWLILLTVGLVGGGMAFFVFGLEGYVDFRTPPRDALEIRATGQKWRWLFTYPNGLTDDILHVPLGTSVLLRVTSNDVVHSLFIPAMRAKVEAVRGRDSELWFRATRPGEFPVYCAEYCGSAYHAMRTRLVVHKPGGYDKWLDAREKELVERPPADLGRLVAERQGCLMCHTIWGGDSVGPTLLRAYGAKRRLRDGSEITVDEQYLAESTLDPEVKIVAGYQPSMPSYRGKLSAQELTGLVEYMKTLK
jgi:cytochrome c oxidase subunit II